MNNRSALSLASAAVLLGVLTFACSKAAPERHDSPAGGETANQTGEDTEQPSNPVTPAQSNPPPTTPPSDAGRGDGGTSNVDSGTDAGPSTPCVTDDDCNIGYICPVDTCVPGCNNVNDCPFGDTCDNGQCNPP